MSYRVRARIGDPNSKNSHARGDDSQDTLGAGVRVSMRPSPEYKGTPCGTSNWQSSPEVTNPIYYMWPMATSGTHRQNTPMTVIVTSYHISHHPITYHIILSHITSSYHISHHPITYHIILSHITSSYHISHHPITYHIILSHITSSYHISPTRIQHE